MFLKYIEFISKRDYSYIYLKTKKALSKIYIINVAEPNNFKINCTFNTGSKKHSYV